MQDSESPKAMNSLVPFAESKRSKDFSRELIEKMARHVAVLREEIVSPQNVSNMPHGHGWIFQQQREDGYFPETGEFKRRSTELSVHHDRILSNDRNLVDELIFSLAQQMHDEFMKGLVQEMDETCNRFGRVTNVPKKGSLADGILASLANIHASVDEDGNVSLPQMMLSPDLIEQLKSELVIRGKELELKAAKIRTQAEMDARTREAERLAKYDQK